MLFLDDEIAGGEFDGLVIAVDEVGGTSDFDSRVMMTSGDGDFLGNEAGVWCDDGGADDVVVLVGE